MSRSLLACLLLLSFPVHSTIRFDGSTEAIVVSDHATLDITGNITISMWMQLTGTPVAYDAPMAKTTDNNWADGFGMYFIDDVTVGSAQSLVFWANSYLNLAYKAFSWSDLNCHHVAAVYDGSNLKLYIDGVQGTNKVFSSAITTNDNGLNIGRSTGNVGAESGTTVEISDFRVYNRALSVSEIESLAFSREHVALTNGLVLWLPMDEGDDGLAASGTGICLDRSGTGNNGSPVDTPMFIASKCVSYP